MGQSFLFKTHTINITGKPNLLYRSESGELLISTDKELVAFDGIHTLPFTFDDGKHRMITTIGQGKNGLWFGANDGNIYKQVNYRLMPWIIPEGVPQKKITAIIEHGNQLWIATYGEGIYIYQDKVLYNIDASDNTLMQNDVYDMIYDSIHGMVIATDRGTLNVKFDIKNGSTSKSIQKYDSKNDIIVDLEQSHDLKHLLTWSEEGELYYFDRFQKKYSVLHDDTHTGFMSNKSLILYDQKKQGFNSYDVSSAQNSSINIKGLTKSFKPILRLLDDENILWFWCQNNGLVSTHIDRKLSLTFNHKVDHFFVVNQNKYTASESSFSLHTKDGKSRTLLDNIQIISHYYDKDDDHIWLGSYSNGIYVIDAKTSVPIKKIKALEGLENQDVFGITKYKGEHWILTLTGIYVINQDGNITNHYTANKGIPTDYNFVIHTNDGKQSLLLGSDGHGLLKFDDTKNTFVSLIPKCSVTGIAITSKDQQIWASTIKSGIKVWPQNTRLDAILTQLPAYHWVGVAHINDSITLGIHKDRIYVINRRSMELNSFSAVSISNKAGQQISSFFFDSTNNTLDLFIDDQLYQLSSVFLSQAKPKILMRSISLGGEIWQIENQSFSFDKNDLDVELCAIWMFDPTIVRQQYRLLPMDTTWRTTQDERLFFANLHHGQYQLEVRCQVDGIPINESLKIIKFVIKPALWQRPWLIILALLSLGAAIWYWIRIRNQKMTELEQLKTEKMKVELDVLKSQINPHFLFNSFNTLISTIEQNPSQAVHMVDKLSSFYRNILMYRDQDLIPLTQELSTLDDYKYLIHQRMGENVIFNMDISGHQQVKIIPLTLQLLTENAIKHNIATKAKPLTITMEIKDDYLIVSNPLQLRKDGGPSTHFGLSSLASRYRSLLKKEMNYSIQDNQFIVKIPLSSHE
jgi:ligand-binding sensor domain-containing protein